MGIKTTFFVGKVSDGKALLDYDYQTGLGWADYGGLTELFLWDLGAMLAPVFPKADLTHGFECIADESESAWVWLFKPPVREALYRLSAKQIAALARKLHEQERAKHREAHKTGL